MSRISGRSARPSQLALGAVAALVLAALIGPAAADSATTHTKIYSTPGVYTFAVPSNVAHITVTAVGAGGGTCGSAIGGDGASGGGTFAVHPGSTLKVTVGGVGGDCTKEAGAGGVGGGAPGGTGTVVDAGGGGGASGVGTDGLAAGSSPLIVAGGGGGGSDCTGYGGNAGSPGGTPTCGLYNGSGGGAGTETAGGAGGAAGSSAGGGDATAGAPGTAGQGGAGGNGDTVFLSSGGGGGGGGYYGGGGGGGGSGHETEGAPGGGGGGGSSFISSKGTNVRAPAATTSTASVTISYTAAPGPTATTHKATGVKSKSATVHGSVNGQGLGTTYWFQWGTSKHYGHKTGSHKLKASPSAKSVKALLGGLKAGTRYHFRVVAKNASGTAHGKDMTFRTAAVAPAFTG
jgi:hypothetical protein